MSHVWSETKKVECVTTWLVVGKLPLVEAVTGVPKATLRQWRMQPWWQELVDQIQTESDQELDTRLVKIVDKSLDVVIDRLENGEFILNSKTGQVIRSPVKMKDAHKVSVELLDKRDLIRDRKTIKVERQATEDLLQKLALQFATFVNKKLENKTLLSGDITDAVYEERKEGLSEGIRQVSGETGTNQEPGRTEQSSQGSREESGTQG